MNKIPDRELIKDLNQVDRETDSYTTSSCYSEEGKYSAGTLINRFGSWKEAAATANIDYRKFRNLDVNDEAFGKPISRDAAWALGYFLADGNLDPSIDQLYFVSKEKAQLRMVREILGSNQSITEREKGTNVLCIQSQELTETLQRMGVQSKKSDSLPFPELRSSVFLDFVRGYFDGDGCVRRSKDYVAVEFVSMTESFLKRLKIELEDTLDLIGGSVWESGKGGTSLGFGQTDSTKIHEEMYSDTTTYNERRKKRFDELLKECEFKSNRSYWTDSEVQYLKRNIENMSLKRIADELGRSHSSVQNKKTRIGL